MSTQTLPFGRWPSPVSAEMLTLPNLGYAEIHVDGTTCWWSEARPEEGGRTQLVRRGPHGDGEDVLPPGFDARTRVHEYGGGAWTVEDGTVVLANLADQRLYRLDPGAREPVALTPEPVARAGLRYGDLSVVAPGTWGDAGWVLAVRESHEPEVLETHGEPVNAVVAVPLDGSAATAPDAVAVLVSGPDFVATPRAHGRRIAWIQWDHPSMPWDSTTLYVAEVDAASDRPAIRSARPVAGHDTPQAVMRPRWSAGGDLWFLSDVTDWWNLYRWDGSDTTHVAPVDGEIGGPAWALGGVPYDLLPDGRIVAGLTREGLTRLVLVDPAAPSQPPRPLDTGLSDVRQVRALPDGRVLAVAGGHTLAFSAVLVSPDGEVEVLSGRDGPDLDPAWWSAGRPVAYPSYDGRTAHAVFYPPASPDCTGPEGSLPPLVVMLHGGPTSSSGTALRMGVQYWTTRGFAVADLDYTGSTGYGRPYRRALYGRWGLVDVEDCLTVVRHLADTGVVDGSRAAIRGGSAGGFTTLAALAHPENTFATGASYYGVADLMALARDTHKFESRYLDQLVGPLPEQRDVYRERSPITHVDRIDVPLLVLQGSEDPVVPPAQSRMIVEALRAKGVECEYVELAGEAHGFRRADSVVRAAETELAFYQRVLGL